MLNVLLPTRRWETPRAWHAMAWCLSLALCSLVTAQRKMQPDTEERTRPHDKGESSKPAPRRPRPNRKPAKAADPPTRPAKPRRPEPDPQDRPERSLSGPRAEKLLGMEKLKTVPAKPVGQNEIFRTSKPRPAASNANIDKEVIRRVVQAMVAKLTDRANVQALVDPPDSRATHAPQAHGIQEATTALLEPIFAGEEHQESGVPDRVLPNLERRAHAAAQEPPDPSRPGDDHPGRVRHCRFLAALL